MVMGRSPRMLAGALLLGAATMAAPAASAAEAVTVGTVGQASANLWPVFIALDKGFFAAEDLKVDVVYVQSSAQLVQQITAGSLDICMSTGLVDPMRAIEHGCADRDRAGRGAGAALCAHRQARDQEARGAQGQGDLARRAEGHHPHLCRAHARAERRQAGRVRHGVRRRHRGARLGAARRRGRRGDPAAAVQLPGRDGGLQRSRLDGRLRQGPAVLRHRGQRALGQCAQGAAAEAAGSPHQRASPGSRTSAIAPKRCRS